MEAVERVSCDRSCSPEHGAPSVPEDSDPSLLSFSHSSLLSSILLAINHASPYSCPEFPLVCGVGTPVCGGTHTLHTNEHLCEGQRITRLSFCKHHPPCFIEKESLTGLELID